MTLTLAGMPWRKEQTADLQRVLRDVDSEIPLVLVSGNHDVGNVPTPETVAEFQQTWGDDYFSFWVGGVLFLVLNSQFLYNCSGCPALKQAQDAWLDQQLRLAEQHRCRHAVVFQHIPLFLQSIDEDDNYFNLTRAIRRELADKFARAGSSRAPGVWVEGRSEEAASRSFSCPSAAWQRGESSPALSLMGRVALEKPRSPSEPQFPRL